MTNLWDRLCEARFVVLKFPTKDAVAALLSAPADREEVLGMCFLPAVRPLPVKDCDKCLGGP